MKNTTLRTHTFYVKGMHCPSCVVLTEDKLTEVAAVHSAKATLAELSVTVTGDFGDTDIQQLAENLSQPLIPHGYSLQLTKPKITIRWEDFTFALPLALCAIVLFIALQKLGIVNLVNTTGNVHYGTAFLIGIIASLSTCMAVIGGLVLSMSASYSKTGQRTVPQLLFHVGRLVSFFVLGGVIGVLGKNVELNTTGIFILDGIIGIVLLILGVNLLSIFPWMQRWQIALPKGLSQRLLGVQKLNSTITPALVGAITFFLPCGFTQSMQIYALSTGSFTTGALTMLSFALGTLPVLAVISFSSFSIRKPTTQSIFFKTAGLVVIFFAIFNLLSGLVVLGVIPPILNI